MGRHVVAPTRSSLHSVAVRLKRFAAADRVRCSVLLLSIEGDGCHMTPCVRAHMGQCYVAWLCVPMAMCVDTPAVPDETHAASKKCSAAHLTSGLFGCHMLDDAIAILPNRNSGADCRLFCSSDRAGHIRHLFCLVCIALVVGFVHPYLGCICHAAVRSPTYSSRSLCASLLSGRISSSPPHACSHAVCVQGGYFRYSVAVVVMW